MFIRLVEDGMRLLNRLFDRLNILIFGLESVLIEKADYIEDFLKQKDRSRQRYELKKLSLEKQISNKSSRSEKINIAKHLKIIEKKIEQIDGIMTKYNTLKMKIDEIFLSTELYEQEKYYRNFLELLYEIYEDHDSKETTDMLDEFDSVNKENSKVYEDIIDAENDEDIEKNWKDTQEGDRLINSLNLRQIVNIQTPSSFIKHERQEREEGEQIN